MAIILCAVQQWSPALVVPGTSFLEDNFSMDWGWVEWFGDGLSSITFIVHFISNLILPLKYLSMAQRLRTPAIQYACCLFILYIVVCVF